jgi:hypothetical protein
MNEIKNIQINTSTLPPGKTNRTLNVTGDNGAKVTIQIFDASSPSKFYNFSTSTFVTGCNNADQSLKVELTNGSFNINVKFPSGGTSYTVLVLAHDANTFISSSLSSDKFLYSTIISQLSSTSTITFTPVTSNTNNFGSMPSSITSSGSPLGVSSSPISVSWQFTSADNNTYGYGLKKNTTYVTNTQDGVDTLGRVNSSLENVDDHFYFQTTQTVDGGITSSYDVVVDSLTDIGVGSVISAVSSGSLSGTPVILNINETSKTLTLDTQQTFADGITLTIQARGSSAIKEAIGADINFETTAWTYNETVIKRKVRTTASGDTIALVGSRGISGGGAVTIQGVNINNASTNTVQTVSLSEVEGSVTVQLAQEIKAGSSIEFFGSTDQVTTTGGMLISKYPDANRVINFNLDNFITIGVSGS